MNYKSQYGQDKWIVENLFGGMTHGYFLDIGAGDGEMISNTWVLEKELQWDGICFDPSERSWEALKRNRKCRVDNTLIAAQEGEVDFYEVTSTGHYDEYFSSAAHTPTSHPQFVVKKKKAERLYTALNRLNSSTLIHYLSIDTEGMEYDILKQFFEDEYVTDNKGWKRRIISLTVEHNGRPEYRQKLKELLEANHYVHVATLGIDDVYVHKIYEVMCQ